MSRQDRQGARTVSEFEQRYQIGKTFSEIMGVANGARDLALETKKMYEGLGHKEIFNLLTNNGEWQGMYEANGDIYINASHIKSGELSADLLKTGIIKSKNYTEAAGLVAQGTSIDLDKGIINSANFKVDEFGKMKATGGYIGGLDITETSLTSKKFNGSDYDAVTLDASGVLAERNTINPGQYTEIMQTALTADGLKVKYDYITDDGSTLPVNIYHNIMTCEIDGRIIDVYLYSEIKDGTETFSVKAKERGA